MRWIVAAFIAVAVFSLCLWRPDGDLSARIRPFVDRRSSAQKGSRATPELPDSVRRAAPFVVVGAFMGLLVAQGDLFVAGTGRPAGVMIVLGGAGGLLVWRIRDAGRTRQRERRYRLELPVVTDAIAMQIVSGESVGTSLERVVATSDGPLSPRPRPRPDEDGLIDPERTARRSRQRPASRWTSTPRIARPCPHPRRSARRLAHGSEQRLSVRHRTRSHRRGWPTGRSCARAGARSHGPDRAALLAVSDAPGSSSAGRFTMTGVEPNACQPPSSVGSPQVGGVDACDTSDTTERR